MFKKITTILSSVWHRHREAKEAEEAETARLREAKEAETARLREAKEAETARLQREMLAEAQTRIQEGMAKRKRENTKQRIQEYEAHVNAVDLSGVIERSGNPLDISDIEKEVEKRRWLAGEEKHDPQIGLANATSDDAIENIAGKLDQTARHFLMEHNDPDRQRKVAKTIMDSRANLNPIPSIDSYVTVVAEAIARERAKMNSGNSSDAIIGRAILIRSTDPRWTRTRHGALRPLSKVPYR
jgi:hypothetical protein